MSIERAVSRTPRLPTGLRLPRRGRTPGEREGRVLAVRRALKIGGLTLAVLALALAILLFASYFQLSQARAEEHNHPVADGRRSSNAVTTPTAGTTCACRRPA